MSRKNDFIKKYGKSALLANLVADPFSAPIFARIMLAQAALETGWGASVPGNNLFGIKNLSWLAGEVWVQTKEYVKGQVVTVTDAFQSFDDATQAFLAYILLIRETTRYKKAWLVRTDPEKYFEEIQKAGYATDPLYAEKCFAVYRSVPENWLELVGVNVQRFVGR